MLDYTDPYQQLYVQYGIDTETVDPILAHFIAYADCPVEADADVAEIFRRVEEDFRRWDAPRPRRRSTHTHSPGHLQRGLPD